MASGEGMRTVELVQAFVWTCDDCGRDNFERAVTVAPESISADDLPDGIDPEMMREWAESGGEGAFAMAPDRVLCRHCTASFGTVHADMNALTD